MIQTIFFDFGNVIAFFDHWRAVRRLLQYTDCSGAELYERLYDGPLEDAFERGAISTEEYVERACAAGGLRCSSEEFLACFRDIFSPNPDVIEAIPQLARHYRLVLASNTNAAHFEHYRQQFHEVLCYFAALPTSHQAGWRKPRPEFFDFCQRFAEAPPAHCLFVDDLAANVEAGQRHGWRGVQYGRGDRLLEKLAQAGAAIPPTSLK